MWLQGDLQPFNSGVWTEPRTPGALWASDALVTAEDLLGVQRRCSAAGAPVCPPFPSKSLLATHIIFWWTCSSITAAIKCRQETSPDDPLHLVKSSRHPFFTSRDTEDRQWFFSWVVRAQQHCPFDETTESCILGPVWNIFIYLSIYLYRGVSMCVFGCVCWACGGLWGVGSLPIPMGSGDVTQLVRLEWQEPWPTDPLFYWNILGVWWNT